MAAWACTPLLPIGWKKGANFTPLFLIIDRSYTLLGLCKTLAAIQSAFEIE
jgi:hypothetical protein